MLSLKEVVDRYATLTRHFGEPVPLYSFGLSPEETTQLFTTLDEDYHISRYLSFSNAQGQAYPVSGSSMTHIRIDPEVSMLL